MHIFYTPDIIGNLYQLSEEESKHCVRVLRLKTGDKVNLVDGKGGFYEAMVSSDNPKACMLNIIAKTQEFESRDYYLHLAVAPTKNTDRLEWLIEKAVEIGIDEFTPIICEHSERRNLNIERLERIAISAMKQSIKAYKPIINECLSVKKLIELNQQQVKLIAHCMNDKKESIAKAYSQSQSVLCLIGPEGDFSQEEVRFATDKGFKGISLGNSRLRTETAGLVACHSFYFINQNS